MGKCMLYALSFILYADGAWLSLLGIEMKLLSFFPIRRLIPDHVPLFIVPPQNVKDMHARKRKSQHKNTEHLLQKQTLQTETVFRAKHINMTGQGSNKDNPKTDKCLSSPSHFSCFFFFSSSNCFLRIILWLDKGDYPENSHAAFCPNE